MLTSDPVISITLGLIIFTDFVKLCRKVFICGFNIILFIFLQLYFYQSAQGEQVSMHAIQIYIYIWFMKMIDYGGKLSA